MKWKSPVVSGRMRGRVGARASDRHWPIVTSLLPWNQWGVGVWRPFRFGLPRRGRHLRHVARRCHGPVNNEKKTDNEIICADERRQAGADRPAGRAPARAAGAAQPAVVGPARSRHLASGPQREGVLRTGLHRRNVRLVSSFLSSSLSSFQWSGRERWRFSCGGTSVSSLLLLWH